MNEQIPNNSGALPLDVAGLVERRIEEEAGVPISQMTPVQVVEAMIAASSAPTQAPRRNGSGTAPGASGLSASISSDPIYQDREVRAMATAELQRLKSLLDAPAPLTLAQLLNGPLSGN